MSVHSYDDLRGHIGHSIQCVAYGADAWHPGPANVAIECVDCGCVLLDFDRDPDYEPEPCEGCAGGVIHGVRFPTRANDDGTREWIERCDTCERFASDVDAARALQRQQLIFDYELARPTGSTSFTPYATSERETETQ